MKTNNFLKSITLLPIVFTPTIFTTCCNFNQGGVEENDEWAQYIFDRTFSLLGTSTAGKCWGTGWILSDATPSDATDYKYNIVTNWHVMKGIEAIHSSGTNDKYWFGCNTKSSGLSVSGDYVEFTSFVKAEDSWFSYDNTQTITTIEWDSTVKDYVEKTGLRGCDVFAATVDFSSCLSSSSTSASTAKTKLDNLNKLTQQGKKITELADVTSDSKHFENMPLYTGGYPVKKSSYATWEKHSLSSEKVTLEYETGTRTSTERISHWSDTSNTPLIDCSPQYISQTNVGTSWMTGGASGSMLVGNFATSSNPTWKICGIYWGGFGNNTNFYPCFSIFNSDWKQYLSEWV